MGKYKRLGKVGCVFINATIIRFQTGERYVDNKPITYMFCVDKNPKRSWGELDHKDDDDLIRVDNLSFLKQYQKDDLKAAMIEARTLWKAPSKKKPKKTDVPKEITDEAWSKLFGSF